VDWLCSGKQLGLSLFVPIKTVLDHRCGHFTPHSRIDIPLLRKAKPVGKPPTVLKVRWLVIVIPGGDEKYIDQPVKKGHAENGQQDHSL
jgi:hypothetical protein